MKKRRMEDKTRCGLEEGQEWPSVTGKELQ